MKSYWLLSMLKIQLTLGFKGLICIITLSSLFWTNRHETISLQASTCLDNWECTVDIFYCFTFFLPFSDVSLVFKAVGSSRGIAQTERVINYLEQSDVQATASETAVNAESVNVSLDLETVTTTLVSDSIS